MIAGRYNPKSDAAGHRLESRRVNVAYLGMATVLCYTQHK